MDDRDWAEAQDLELLQRLDDALWELNWEQERTSQTKKSLELLRASLETFSQFAHESLDARNTPKSLALYAEAVAGALSQIDQLQFVLRTPAPSSSLNSEPDRFGRNKEKGPL